MCGKLKARASKDRATGSSLRERGRELLVFRVTSECPASSQKKKKRNRQKTYRLKKKNSFPNPACSASAIFVVKISRGKIFVPNPPGSPFFAAGLLLRCPPLPRYGSIRPFLPLMNERMRVQHRRAGARFFNDGKRPHGGDENMRKVSTLRPRRCDGRCPLGVEGK